MLDKIAETVSKLARNVIINHPNACECHVYRKEVTRDGAKLMGGMGVLSSEDETEFTYKKLGEGYLLNVDAFQPTPMTDQKDGSHYGETEIRFAIEPESMTDEEGWFSVSKYDVVFMVIAHARFAYEVVSVEAMMNIPPFAPRYVCNRRGDLDVFL